MRKRWKVIVRIWMAGAFVAGSGQFNGMGGAGGPQPMEHVLAAGSPSPTVEAADVSPDTADASSETSDGASDLSTATPQPASGGLQSQLSEAQKKREALQQEKQLIEAEVDRVQRYADNIIKYVKTLDTQFNRLNFNIEANKASVKRMKEEVETVNQEFELAQERQQTQYDSMKARIKYMYENSDDSYLQFLLESRSLAELFSREEYIEKITSYDKTLFSKYQAVLAEVTAAKEKAKDKLDEVEATKEALKYERQTLKKLSKEKNRQIQTYQEMLASGQANLAEYAEKISAQEQKIEAILQEQREEIAAQEAETDGSEPQVLPVTGDYAWPLTVRGRISSPFGYRSAPTAGATTYHKGVDWATPTGTAVNASCGGTVAKAGWGSGYGYVVYIDHPDGRQTRYGHLSKVLVSVGQTVTQGQKIALSGNTGVSTGPHLHFEILINGSQVNPLNYLN